MEETDCFSVIITHSWKLNFYQRLKLLFGNYANIETVIVCKEKPEVIRNEQKLSISPIKKQKS